MAVQAQYPSSGFSINFQMERIIDETTDLELPQATVPLQLSSCLQNQNQSRMQCSARTSTSSSGVTKFIHLYNSEIDALIRIHNDQVRSEIEEIQKSHYNKVLPLVQRKMKETLREKDAELEMARKKNIELEAKMSQVTAENRIWFDFARNSETIARGLKADLDRVLRQVPADRHVADDAESCCDRKRGNPKCRACRGRDVSVLMLPCRHLCLCKECEPEADTCPICEAKKNGSVQVFMD